MCKTCVQKTRSVVRIEGTLSSFFENKTGLKQDDSLSPILFNLALQDVTQSTKMVPSGIKIGREQLNVLAHVYMVMSRDQNAGRIHSMRIDKSTIERVEEFKYLGTTLTIQNSIQEEIKSRLRSRNACYHSVQNLLSSRLQSRKLKI